MGRNYFDTYVDDSDNLQDDVPNIQPIKKKQVNYYDLLKNKKKERKKEKYIQQPAVMSVGKYAGKPVDQLPLSYCRWIISQKFDKNILYAAKKKVDASIYAKTEINVSRHAVDMFSIRFIDRWINNPDKHKIGIGTFLANIASEAWKYGQDVSKNRHEDDGIVKLYQDIKFVFTLNDTFPDYKELVTVM